MDAHVHFTVDTDIQFYFCAPQSSWHCGLQVEHLHGRRMYNHHVLPIAPSGNMKCGCREPSLLANIFQRSASLFKCRPAILASIY